MIQEDDLPVAGAPPEDNGEPISVKQLLEEMKAELGRQKKHLEEAEERERIVLGEQWRVADAQLENQLSAGEGDLGHDLVQENLVYPLCLTWAAVVDQGRIDPRGYPFQPTQQDVEAAKAVDTILDFEKQRCSEPELISEAAEYAQMHGDVLFYPQWSEAEGPFRVKRQVVDKLGPVVDVNGPVYEDAWEFGGVVEDVIAAPDYWTDGAYHYKDATCVVVRRIINRYVAKKRLRACRKEETDPVTGAPIEGEKRFPDADPKDNDFPTATESTRRGVECFEIWLKPGPRTESGCFCLVIDNKAVLSIPYPKNPETGKIIYDGQLPGDVWKIGNIRGSSRGKTHVADAIHQQKIVNAALQSILERAEQSREQYIVGSAEIVDSIPSARHNRISYDGEKDLTKILGFFSPDDIPAGLFKAYHDARAALRDTFGVSVSTSTGGDPEETKSGVQMREAKAADGQKIRPARGRLEKCRKKVAKDKITLWQVHADSARLVRVLGPGGDVAARYLRSADLQGADVALEVSSGLLNSHIGRQKYAEESAAAGYMSLQKAGELRETGLTQTVDDAQGLARIESQARQALGGRPVEPMPDVNPQMAAERLQELIGAYAMDGEDPTPIVRLAQMYKQLAAALKQSNAGRPQPMGGGGPPKPNGAPKVTETRAEQPSGGLPQ